MSCKPGLIVSSAQRPIGLAVGAAEAERKTLQGLVSERPNKMVFMPAEYMAATGQTKGDARAVASVTNGALLEPRFQLPETGLPPEKRLAVAANGHWRPTNGHLTERRGPLDGLHRYDHLSADVAINVAARMGDVGMLNELLRKSVSVESANRHGWRPLHGAVAAGRIECVKALIAARAQVAATDRYGWTPLHDACARGELEIARLLLQAGADKSARDLAGLTPLDLARANRRDDCVQLIAGNPPAAKQPPKPKTAPRSRKPAAATADTRGRKRPASPGTVPAPAPSTSQPPAQQPQPQGPPVTEAPAPPR